MKILLLEDDTALNRAIKKITELDGHITTNYFDGQDVYDSLDDKYDLYILDINVPNINGLELLKLIHAKNNISKVIIISANSDIHSLTEAYKFGCIDYLKKPFHLEELRIKIAKEGFETEEIVENVSLNNNLSLTKKEKIFLTLLLKNRDKVVNYTMIEDGVYDGSVMSMDSLRALVRRLRAKLKDMLIENVLDEGYKINS
jgi:DNA-binding response OmpR family regulator